MSSVDDGMPSVERREFSLSPGFFWGTVLLASFVSSVVSLFTTALGLVQYQPSWIAYLLSFAVQAGLFAFAWLIGLAKGPSKLFVIVIYILIVPFSIVFSFVFLHGQFTAKIRPREAQINLLDDLRRKSRELSTVISSAFAESENLDVRLNKWQQIEDETGYAVSTCLQETNCYLKGVCDRVRKRVDAWESIQGRLYREGPGKQLIFSFLSSEVDALRARKNRISDFKTTFIDNNQALAPNIDNSERLSRFDRIVSAAPVDDLKAVLCREIALPAVPKYADVSRDRAIKEELPTYASEDLWALFDQTRTAWSKGDSWTAASLSLAIFIDGFVLLIALGTTTTLINRSERYPITTTLPDEWLSRLHQDIDRWLQLAHPDSRQSVNLRRSFATEILAAIQFSEDGMPYLVPVNIYQWRFGRILVHYEAATSELQRNGEGREVFAVEDWLIPALSSYVASA